MEEKIVGAEIDYRYARSRHKPDSAVMTVLNWQTALTEVSLDIKKFMSC